MLHGVHSSASPSSSPQVGGSKLEIDRYPEPTYHEGYIRMNQSTGKVRVALVLLQLKVS